MHNRWLRILLAALGAYLVVRFLFVPLLPFVISLTFAVLLEPCVLWCRRRFGFRRKFAAAALTSIFLTMLVLVLCAMVGKLIEEGGGLIERLPAALKALPALMDEISLRYDGFYRACPEEIRLWLDNTLQQLSKEGLSMVGTLSGELLSWASGWMGRLPQVVLFLFTTVLSVYFTTLSYPEILRFIRRQIPSGWQKKARGMMKCLRSTFWKWLKAESILCFITFCMLLLGFWYLKLDYALLTAVVVAVIDALPVLGTGTVLIPWSIYHLLLGSVPRGVALLALYAIILLVRNLLEPRLMAAQVGLPPLTALLASYLGFCLFGVGGMLLLPIALLFVKQLQDGGFIRLWK